MNSGPDGRRGVDGAGGDRVDAHAAGAVLGRPGARHRLERRLRRAVGRAAHEPDAAGHAADADDAAVAAGGHAGSERRDEEERRADVAGEHRVERGDVELRGRAEERDPGVVDQDVDVADVARQALHVGGVAQVGGDEAGLAAGGGDLLDRLARRAGVAAVDDDLGSVAGQLSATARPMPDVAPVTSARCPSKIVRVIVDIGLLRSSFREDSPPHPSGRIARTSDVFWPVACGGPPSEGWHADGPSVLTPMSERTRFSCRALASSVWHRRSAAGTRNSPRWASSSAGALGFGRGAADRGSGRDGKEPPDRRGRDDGASAVSFPVGIGAAEPSESVAELAPLLRALFDGPEPLLDRAGLSRLHAAPEQRYWRLQELQSLLERAAMDSPLLIFLDDVQWADSGTVAALRALPPRLASIPIGWVLAMRPDQGPGQLRSAVEHLADEGAKGSCLSRSATAAVAQVASDVMQAEPDETLLAMAAEAGGNPFLLVELLEGLRQEDLVRVDSGRATLTAYQASRPGPHEHARAPGPDVRIHARQARDRWRHRWANVLCLRAREDARCRPRPRC